MARVMEITTPLGDDVLLFHGMHAREEMGRVGEAEVVLLSPRGDVGLDDVLGKNVTIKLALPNDGTRFFNGYVTRFSQSGTFGRYHRYYANVNSWLWFLSRTTDCRIFQEMTVPEIVKQVFSEHSAADFKDETTLSYRTWNYCVQYRETDLNFVSRLMEHEGIYYYFKHTDGKHTLVMADSYSAHEPHPDAEILPFISPDRLARPDIEHVSTWEVTRQIQPGSYVHDDYDLERPSVELRTRQEVAWAFSPGTYEVFDYPGNYLQKLEGEQYAAVRIEELAAQWEAVHGATNAKALSVGHLFTLDGCPRADQNREHLIVSATYDLEYSDYEAMGEGGGASYRCTFEAISSRQQFRSRRVTPKPSVQGPQTAMVVGPAGDEIYTDKYGRVKVQFHWDRLGKNDENSSCWIRVSQPWAGKGWGSVSTPRIGQEVIVDFLEGDPDQPIITGRVYNAESQPPFGFPAGAVISGHKSQTHKGAGYNEMSMDDTAGKEKITVHGQYDMNTTVEHDQTTTVHNNRTDTVDVNDSETVGNNQTCSVGVNQDTSVGANQTLTVGGNQTTSVSGNQTLTVGAAQSESVGSTKTETIAIAKALSIGAGYQVSVGGGMNETIGAAKAEEIGGAKIVAVGALSSELVGGSKSIKAGGSISETAAANVAVKAGSNYSATAAAKVDLGSGGNMTLDSKAKTVVNAASELALKCGGAMIVLKSGGEIVIQGTDITVKGSTISIKGSGDVNIKGSVIKEN